MSRRLRRYLRAAYTADAALGGDPFDDLLDGDDVSPADSVAEGEPRSRSASRHVRRGSGPRDGSRGRATRYRWRTRPAVAVRAGAIVLSAGLVAAAWVVLRPGPTGPEVPLSDPAAVTTASDGPGTPGAAPPSAMPADPADPEVPPAGTTEADGAAVVVVVHVAGAVRDPGVVELPVGSRVQAALDATGGAATDADLDTLNLAALLVDGQQVYVPRVGEDPGGGAPGSGAGGSATPAAPDPGGAAGGAPGGVLVDLNTADSTTLQTLPGVGPAIAQRIIDHRDQNGPFASVEALDAVSGIGPASMARLRDLVTV